jgi:hypothetical protein
MWRLYCLEHARIKPVSRGDTTRPPEDVPGGHATPRGPYPAALHDAEPFVYLISSSIRP